jgi:phosphate/sulfate permease
MSTILMSRIFQQNFRREFQMRSLMLLTTLFWACVFLLAAWLMSAARSPPAAYAAAILGVGAVGGLCLSLIIIWLATA